MRRLLALVLVAAWHAGAALATEAARLPSTAVRTAGTLALGEYAMPARTIKELKLRAAFATTVHQQFDYSCGSAALATLLTYHYGRAVDEQTVFRAMYEIGDQTRIKREGFSLLDMKRVLAANGYDADGFEASLDDIVEARVPAIALIRENGYNHFVVVKGVVERHVLLGDPSVGTRIVTRKDFEAMWQAGIFFVIRSHQEIARFNVPEHWRVKLGPPLAAAIDRNLIGNVLLTAPSGNSF